MQGKLPTTCHPQLLPQALQEGVPSSTITMQVAGVGLHGASAVIVIMAMSCRGGGTY